MPGGGILSGGSITGNVPVTPDATGTDLTLRLFNPSTDVPLPPFTVGTVLELRSLEDSEALDVWLEVTAIGEEQRTYRDYTVNVLFGTEGTFGQESCQAEGGQWQREFAPPFDYFCNHLYLDAGTECQSSDECEGWCLIPDAEATLGECQQFERLSGCVWKIEDPVGICID